ncbi:MAG: twin-arginine translocation signal domain-containing protein [Thermomicrobiales bacterium]
MSSFDSTGNRPAPGQDAFEYYFRQILAGKISRRDAIKRTAVAGAAVTGAVAAAPAIRPALRTMAQDAEPVAGGTFRMGMQSDPGALDTQLQSLTAAWHVVEHIYSNLTSIMPDMSVAPDLWRNRGKFLKMAWFTPSICIRVCSSTTAAKSLPAMSSTASNA